MTRAGLLVALALALAACTPQPTATRSPPTDLHAQPSQSLSSPTPTSTPTPTPGSEPAAPKPLRHVIAKGVPHSLTCRRAFVVPEHERVVHVRKNAVVLVKGERSWVRYVNRRKIVPLSSHEARDSVIDVLYHPRATASARGRLADGGLVMTVVQRSWSDPTRPGVWFCS